MALLNTWAEALPPNSPGYETPLLRWDLRFIGKEGEAVLQVEEDIYSFSPLKAEALRAIIEAIDGRRTPAEIARVSGRDLDLVRQILSAFYENGIAKDLNTVQGDRIESRDFINICRTIFPVWKQRLFTHPLWRGLATGEASETLFLGWLLEHYHYIEGANDRMSIAVAECNNLSIRPHIAHHYSEEYDHGKFLLKCLRNFGFDDQTTIHSRPLPGTISLLNYMRRAARQDGLNYAICSGFLESSGGDRNIAKSFLDCLEEHYCKNNPNGIKPLRAHAELDESLGHGSLLEAILEDVGSIDHTRATEALTAGYAMLEVLEMWSTDIERTYTHPDALRRTGLPNYRPVAVSGQIELVEVG